MQVFSSIQPILYGKFCRKIGTLINPAHSACEEFLALSARWVYVYNVLRPHMGVGMEGKPPLTVLKELGYNGDEAIALFPPIILDWISADLILSCDKEVGNDLLAHYIGKDNE
jgi:hypothetical protein